MRKFFAGVILFLMMAGILIFLLPDRYLPAGCKPAVSVSGRFEGKPVQFAVPDLGKSATAVELEVTVDDGVCTIGPIDPNGRTSWTWRMGGGAWSGGLPPRTVLRIDPGRCSGRYAISAGLPWYFLGREGRLVIFVTCVLGLIFYGVALRCKDALQNYITRRIGSKRFVTIAVLLTLSGLLYSAVHEFGHIAFGMLGGGKPNWQGVVWTPFSGEQPMASFREIPEIAQAWMSAGGVLFPTILGVLLVSIWICWSKRLPWYLAVAVIVPGLTFLIANIAIPVELITTGHAGHMEVLAQWYHFSAFRTLAWDLLPFLLTLGAFMAAGYRLWGRHER
jgi:hypothetical protein